jgi:hypothetical protein
MSNNLLPITQQLVADYPAIFLPITQQLVADYPARSIDRK